MEKIKFIDLFCGIGGFRIATETISKERGLTSECVFSSDIDSDACTTYEANFGERPFGDICKVEASNIPDHNILFAGFPCQPFSIIGMRKGFEDTRGTLFFEIARILDKKRPEAFVLENVKMLAGHNEGKTLKHIMEVLNYLGYHAQFRILNALDYGVPQKRERIYIVGFLKPRKFIWPAPKGKAGMTPLEDILEQNVPDSYKASPKILASRLGQKEKVTDFRTIWHENKAGHISAYPFSCALRAGASYNYLLVDGERRLTEREMLRLQGFPDSYKIVTPYGAMRKLTGNSVAVPVVKAVFSAVLDSLQKDEMTPIQATFFEPHIFSNFQKVAF